MKTNNQFVSVDWGTTNFRLRLVDRESEDINDVVHNVSADQNKAKMLLCKGRLSTDILTRIFILIAFYTIHIQNIPFLCVALRSAAWPDVRQTQLV